MQDVVYLYGETNKPIRVVMFLAKPLSKVDEGEGLGKWVEINKAREIIWPNGVPLLDEAGL